MTTDEFLHAVAQLISSADTLGGGIKASTLGNLILRSLPEHWRNHGFLSLKEVLLRLESAGLAKIVDGEKGVLSVRACTRPMMAAAGTSTEHRRLRSDIWVAFVNTSPPGMRYFHKKSGDVLLGQTTHPKSTDGWIPIVPINQETQKNWVRELLVEFNLDSLREVLGSPSWYLSLSDELRKVRPDVLTQWNRIRTTKVKETVVSWCDQNAVDRDIVLVGSSHSMRSTERPAVADSATVPEQVGNARDVVMRALSRMPIAELLAIPIAGKYFFDDAGRD